MAGDNLPMSDKSTGLVKPQRSIDAAFRFTCFFDGWRTIATNVHKDLRLPHSRMNVTTCD
jgi:hypothetical protein